MEKSLGLIEVRGLSSAIEVADCMVKTADVVLLGVEAARGNGMMTVKVNGNVGAVRAAVEAGKAKALFCKAFVSSDIIARPHESLAGCLRAPTEENNRPNFYIDERPRAVAEKKEKTPSRRTTRRPRRTRKPQPAVKVEERINLSIDEPEVISSQQDDMKSPGSSPESDIKD